MSTNPIPLAARTQQLTAFKVMDIMDAAAALQAQGRDIIRMDVGEPRFELPTPVREAAQRALNSSQLGYTPPCGIEPLREAIADHYKNTYQLAIPTSRIIVTTGSSAALGLLCDLLFNPGEGVLLSDPGYPCNPNFLRRSGIEPQPVVVNAEEHFLLSSELIASHWQHNTRGVLLASPGNPTGELVNNRQLEQLCQEVDRRNGILISDELYHGLTYTDLQPQSALGYSERAFVINGFSKYFGMTGWRLGWMVIPEECLERVTVMLQNFYISSPFLSQHAALAAFSEESLAIFQQRRDTFQERRDFLANALQQLGFGLPHIPEGGFYLYADISAFSDNCEDFCQFLLHQHGISCTPGTDFGSHHANSHIRFSYIESLERLKVAVDRLAEALANC